MQQRGGQWTRGYQAPASTETAKPEGQRINMVTAIRRTLERELEINPRVLLFGEDIGPKGGSTPSPSACRTSSDRRVFDTSLSEEGIVGRAVGMALAGLMPVPEIQFRKYAEPALEQINDCGTMRWRTNNRFAAPMVLRIPSASSSAAIPGTARPTRCSSSTIPAGGWRRRPMPRTRGLAAFRAARQRSHRLLRASRDARRSLGAPAHGRATIMCCRSAGRRR
jgi:hypothetical protein